MSSLADAAIGTLSDLGQLDPALEVPDDDTPDLPDLLPASDPDGDDPPDDPDEPLELPDDPEALKAQVVKLHRKAEHEKAERIKTGVKLWRTEALTHYPYSAPEKITAESRNDFMRQAKERDTAFREQAAPILAGQAAREAKIKADADAEAEARYANSWGNPTVGSRPGVPKTHEAKERVERARGKRDLKGIARAFMDDGTI